MKELYKKKKNQNKRFQKQNFVKKMNFVHGRSSETDKEFQLRRQANEEFFAQKKQHQQAKDVSNKTCFKYNQVGHISRKCPQNSKPVNVEQKNQKIRK
ncbi:putative transcription factor interactor and regulator CCHC(Zn) family [Helianthus anomalus]